MNKSPRERRQERTRQDIVEKAFQLIRENGLEKFSLREVARRADFSPAGLYEYFSDKDDLIRAVSIESANRLLPELEAVPRQAQPDAYVLELCLAFLRYARREPTYIGLLSRNNPCVAEQFEKYTLPDLLADPITRLFHDAIQECIEAGVFLESESSGTLDIFYGLWTMCLGMIFVQVNLFLPQAFDFEAIDRLALGTFLAGLAHQSDDV
ncbi:TetR family transcriptional regulator [Candidatus Peregrinibacteria bacterium]|nr:TetR family transcriptional regulator [Candidatus Peregrinibacteria bacterium]